jgi:hypothetical protein
MDEGHDSGNDEDHGHGGMEQFPPTSGEHHDAELEHTRRDRDEAEQNGNRAYGRVVETQHDQRNQHPAQSCQQPQPPGPKDTSERVLCSRDRHGNPPLDRRQSGYIAAHRERQ